jgi:hypothetical protein
MKEVVDNKLTIKSMKVTTIEVGSAELLGEELDKLHGEIVSVQMLKRGYNSYAPSVHRDEPWEFLVVYNQEV